MNNKRKGFTLIELLAVIVILAVIALISTPAIIGVIEKARKGAFENSAYGILDAGELYFTTVLADANAFSGKNFDFTENIDDLKLSGEKPAGGNLVLDSSGKQSLAIWDKDQQWCAYKNFDEEKVTSKPYSIGDCKVSVSKDPTPEACFNGEIVDGGYKITEYLCPDIVDVVIPNTIGGVPVTVIGENALSRLELTSLVLPNELVEIGTEAIAVNYLTQIVFPSKLKKIGYAAFADNQLAQLNLPDGIEHIDSTVFTGNQIAGTVTIPDSVTYLGDHAFSSGHINKVIIGSGLTYLDSQVFEMNQIETVVMSDNITRIEYSTFYQNQIHDVTLSKNLAYIGNSAFSDNKLTQVTLPPSVTTIEYNAFENNLNLQINIQKPANSISGSPWGASSVKWNG